MPNDAYRYCATLTRDQWAWEFLRRNRDYQDDYRAFIAIWSALEADYGVPPQRDFSKWKQDPRAYGPLPDSLEPELAAGDLCRLDDDRVLLECWMGAKWGFHKFPLDPTCVAPMPEELSWRTPPQRNIDAEPPFRLDVSFDLSLPLAPQLDAAKFRLVGGAAELRRRGFAAPKTVANQRDRWTHLLEWLDAAETHHAIPDSQLELLDEARAMTRGGYLDILRLS